MNVLKKWLLLRKLQETRDVSDMTHKGFIREHKAVKEKELLRQFA